MTDHRIPAIARLIEQAQARQSQVEPFLALHAPESVIVNFGGRRVLGRDQLRTAMTAALASPLAQVTTTTEIEDIRFLRPDIALVSCTKKVHDDRGESEKFATTGSLTYVLVEQEGEWVIALAQTTPVVGS